MSHSKRNTSLAFFTSHERSLLRSSWGSQSTRLSRDSFLPFASCRLCLLPAREPVACTSAAKADLFCRECALSDLMAQHKEIKRLEKEWETAEIEREDEEARAREEQRQREVEEFEKVNQGLDRKADYFGQNGRKRKAEEMHDGSGRAPERSRADDDGKTEASFWVPGVDVSETNGRSAKKAKPEKLVPLCPASTSSTEHTYSLKTLVPIIFTEDEDSKTGQTIRICPSCRKGLSNSSRAILAKPCGHVICGGCVDQFMKPPHPDKAGTNHAEDGAKVKCYVCEADVTEKKAKNVDDGVKHKDKDKIRPGLAEISCEGTGFAGGGANIAKKQGVAFQC